MVPPNSGVNRSPESMRDLAAALGVFSRDVGRAGKTFRSKLGAADWGDPQKDRFEQRFDELQKAIDSFLKNDIEAMRRYLLKDASRLDEIVRTRMG